MYICVKVILYNFFEESVAENLWRYLADGDQHKLEDMKYAPLIHEVRGRTVFSISEV